MMFADLLGEPDDVLVCTEDGWSALTRSAEERWSGGRVAVSVAVQERRLDIALQAAAGVAVKTVKLRWRHTMRGDVRLLGDHWERAYGDLEWRGLVPERVMPWYVIAWDGSFASGIGVVTGAGAMCCWQVDAGTVTLAADVRCGNAGVLPGQRELAVATVVALNGDAGETPYAFARRFCASMCERPAMPAHPVYGGNNWYYAYGDSAHEQIVADSRFVASLAPTNTTNRPYMVIDDGWQLRSGGGACNGGPWTGNAKFPDMEALAGEMRQAGVRPGIWCRPLLTTVDVPEAWRRYTAKAHVLDPSVPDVLDYVAQTIGTLAGWGYALIKHDFSTFDMLGKWGLDMGRDVHGLPYAFADRSKTTAEIALQLYRTIAEASGSAVVIGCNTIGHLAAGLFEIQRTGDDTSGKAWERTRRMGVNTLAFRMAQHGTFFSHDADCVGITERVPWELNRQWLRLLAASGTPLFVSADPAATTPAQQRAIGDAFALASKPLPPAEPLDWLHNTCPAEWLLNGEAVAFDWADRSPDADAHDDNIWWR